jgi:uncharacterized protein (DUF697 family)
MRFGGAQSAEKVRCIAQTVHKSCAALFTRLDKGENVTKDLTKDAIIYVLDFAYDKAVNGVGGMDSASKIAKSYMKVGGSKIEQANSLIRWQNTKAGVSGFLTGLGGIIVMPVAIPANIVGVMYVQVRMIAAIAHIGGYDLKDDRVKALVYTCIAGNAAKDIMKDIGIVVGRKLTENAIRNISGKTIMAINQKIGFRLLTKFGEKGIVNLGKTVPIVGGIIGALLDSATTNSIGNIARNTFIANK